MTHQLERNEAIALLPKLPALISILSSYVILRETFTDLKAGGSCPSSRNTGGRNRNHPIMTRPLTRTLIAMCIADVCFSFPFFLSTWMIPASDTSGFYWGNVGYQWTCDAAAALVVFGQSAVALFNLQFSLFSWLMVTWGWKDFHLAKLEPWLQTGFWVGSAAIAIFPIPLGLYNPVMFSCWFGRYPPDCKGTDCERGEFGTLYQEIFAIFPTWICFFITMALMLSMFCTVRKLEHRMSRYEHSWRGYSSNDMMVPSSLELGQITSSSNQQPGTNLSLSRGVMQQAILYGLAFLLTYALDFVSVFIESLHEVYTTSFIFFAVLMPLQGFWNLLAFIRHRTDMRTREGRFVRRFLCCQCLACRCTKKKQNRSMGTTVKDELEERNPPDDQAKNDQEKKGELPSNGDRGEQLECVEGESERKKQAMLEEEKEEDDDATVRAFASKLESILHAHESVLVEQRSYVRDDSYDAAPDEDDDSLKLEIESLEISEAMLRQELAHQDFASLFEALERSGGCIADDHHDVVEGDSATPVHSTVLDAATVLTVEGDI